MDLASNWISSLGYVKDNKDPEGLGRIQVYIPALDGSKLPGKLTWISVKGTPDGLGNDASRPPQIGERIETQYSKINPALRVASASINTAKNNDTKNFNGDKLSDSVKKLTETKNENVSGPPKGSQGSQSNSDRGASTSAQDFNTEETTQKTVAERSETPNTISDHSEIPIRPPRVNNVSTALTEQSSIMSSAINSLMPGTPFGLGNIFDFITGSVEDELKDALPQNLFTALKNIAGMSGSISSGTPDNFSMDSNRVNPATFAATMLAQLKGCKTYNDLRKALHNLEHDDALKDLASMAGISIDMSSIFGELSATLNANGTMSVSMSEAASQAQSLLQSAMSQIPTFGSSKFQEGSTIVSQMMPRMKQEFQNKLKAHVESLSGSDSTRNTLHSHLNTLNGMLS